jgi:protease I
VTVDVGLDRANADEYDAVFVPGGHSPDRLRILPAAVAFLAGVHAAGGLTAAICHGPWLLIEAGLVRGRTLTGWASVRTDVINAGGSWVDAPVVQDGLLVTSRRPEDVPEFSEALVQLLADARRPLPA